MSDVAASVDDGGVHNANPDTSTIVSLDNATADAPQREPQGVEPFANDTQTFLDGIELSSEDTSRIVQYSAWAERICFMLP